MNYQSSDLSTEFRKEYSVRTHEVDRFKNITVPSLLMLMQEASMQQVVHLKASVWDMEKMKISWVLLRKELTVVELPKLGEKIEIVTYPAGFDRVFAFRDYKVFGPGGKLLAYAGSTWTLINTETRKMERIPEIFFHLIPPQSQERLAIPKRKIEEVSSPASLLTYQVGHFDLDWNGHVNNVVLSKLLLQGAPETFLYDKDLVRFTIHVKSECHLNEHLEIQFEPNEDRTQTRHRIVDLESRRVIANALAEWSEK